MTGRQGGRAGPDALAALLRSISGVRLICLGDVMLDRYVHGRVERLSPEAPVPVLAVEGESETPGAAGNVARNAAALGAEVELIAVSGADEEGERLARLLGGQEVRARLLVEAGRRTTVKTRYLAGGRQLLRADRESAAPLGAETCAEVLRHVEAALARADAVILSDYG